MANTGAPTSTPTCLSTHVHSGGGGGGSSDSVGFGDRSIKSYNTVYYSATDAIVTAEHTYVSSWPNMIAYADTSNPPTTERLGHNSNDSGGGQVAMTFVVKAGEYWKVSIDGNYTDQEIVYTPLTGGGGNPSGNLITYLSTPHTLLSASSLGGQSNNNTWVTYNVPSSIPSTAGGMIIRVGATSDEAQVHVYMKTSAWTERKVAHAYGPNNSDDASGDYNTFIVPYSSTVQIK